MKFSLLAFALLLLLLPFTAFGAFDDVSLSTGAILRVTVGGTTIDLTVTSGTVEKIDILAGNLTITLAAGSSINLTSSLRRTLNYSIGNIIANFECTSSLSRLSLSLSAGKSTESVVITPSTNTCTTGGGGSGSSPSSSISTSTTQTTTTTDTTDTITTTTADTSITPEPFGVEPETPEQLTPPPSVPTPAVTVSALFTAGFSRGQSNADIKRLQQLLNSDPDTQVAASGVGSTGSETNFFGSLTERAVQKFQLKYGVVSSASDLGYGYVGPKTRAMLNTVFAGVAPAAPEVAQPSPIAVSVSPVFNTGLSRGASNADIKRLQQLLNSDPDTQVAASGVGSAGSETNFFGSLTERAVQKFQLKYGVVSSASDLGYGYVGPKTRAMLQAVFSN